MASASGSAISQRQLGVVGQCGLEVLPEAGRPRADPSADEDDGDLARALVMVEPDARASRAPGPRVFVRESLPGRGQAAPTPGGHDRRLFPGQLAVDDRLQRLELHRAHHPLAVHEQGGRAAHAHPAGQGLVLADARPRSCPTAGRRSNLARSRPSSLANCGVDVGGERLLVLEELVVHLPELALLAGRLGRLAPRGSPAGAWAAAGASRPPAPCSPYVCSTCARVGSTRPQNGHWKSEKSTSVTEPLRCRAPGRRREARARPASTDGDGAAGSSAAGRGRPARRRQRQVGVAGLLVEARALPCRP